jgi:CRISPR system Cascade subunit CasE
MYLTKLLLDPHDAQARRDLANAYDMHRTLSRVYAKDESTPLYRFLWRLEPFQSFYDGATLLVQSEEPGNWDVLRRHPGYLLEMQADKKVDIESWLSAGGHYHFRLLANPTVKRDGKRYGLCAEDEQLKWLQRQLEKGGCELRSVLRSLNERRVARKGDTRLTVQAVRFDGVLCLRDVAKARVILRSGIGHAKSLGLGLLSLRRAPA